MPEKRKRRATATRHDGNDFISVDGVIGRFVDNVCDNPAMSGGLFVMALTATAIVSNAMFLQNVRHPEPLFATRPPLVIERHVPAATPIPPHRDDATGSIPPPLPRPAPIPPQAATESAEMALVREIQTVLARKGLYLGAIDGMYGALSRSAIAAYQNAAGLPVSGEPSPALLEHMRTAVEAPPPVSAPPIVAAIPPELPAPSEAVMPPVASAPSAEEVRAELERLRYERVQTALNRIGYGPVAVNGSPDEETANAIRRFELDNGLPLSGMAGEEVVDRLVAIGALPAT